MIILCKIIIQIGINITDQHIKQFSVVFSVLFDPLLQFLVHCDLHDYPCGGFLDAEHDMWLVLAHLFNIILQGSNAKGVADAGPHISQESEGSAVRPAQGCAHRCN